MFRPGDIVRIGPCNEGCEDCLGEVERQIGESVGVWVPGVHTGKTSRFYLLPASALTLVK